MGWGAQAEFLYAMNRINGSVVWRATGMFESVFDVRFSNQSTESRPYYRSLPEYDILNATSVDLWA